MICFFEMQCKGWEHIQVNAGFVKLVKEVYSHERLIFCGEKKHINNVIELVGEKIIEPYELSLPKNIVDSVNNYEEYGLILKNALLDIEPENKSKIILLSAHKGIILSAYQLGKEFTEYNFSIVVHSLMEQLYHKNSKFHKVYRLILRRERNLDWVLKKLDENFSNIRFIIYVPNYKLRLQGKLPEKVISRFYFLHHPYVFGQCRNVEPYGRKKIAVIGAALNKNAYKIIGKCKNMEIDFYVLRRTKIKLDKFDNVKIINQGNGITTEDINYCLDSSQGVLIPYGKKQYIMTASGVFWDAIAHYKPVLCLDSSYFTDYLSDNEIGIVANSISELSYKMNELNLEKSKQYNKNIITFIDKVKNENSILIKRILGD